MERNLQIAKVNLKYNLLPHVVICFLFFIAAPAMMGIENLNQYQTAQVLEMFVSLFGIILFIPQFLPDQDKNIRDLLESKKESMLKIQFIRFFVAFLSLSFIILMFLLRLKYGGCSFEFGKLFYGTMANCIFLGGLGILIYGFVDNVAVAYMVPILYYILNYGPGKKLGKFYLFTMARGSSDEKLYILIAGIIMIACGIGARVKKVGVISN